MMASCPEDTQRVVSQFRSQLTERRAAVRLINSFFLLSTSKHEQLHLYTLIHTYGICTQIDVLASVWPVWFRLHCDAGQKALCVKI